MKGYRKLAAALVTNAGLFGLCFLPAAPVAVIVQAIVTITCALIGVQGMQNAASALAARKGTP